MADDRGKTALAGYGLDNAWSLADRRLALLEQCLDPDSFRRLAAVGVGAGWRCLELGAGRGSVARWLAAQVGSTGSVVAADIDTRFLDRMEAENLAVRRLDVATDALPDGFDLVHTRLLLMHLPDRDALVGRLVQCLKPGGVLLIEEADQFPVAAAASSTYRAAWDWFSAALCTFGMKADWARNLPSLLANVALDDVGVDCRAHFFGGRSPMAELLRLSLLQVSEQMAMLGASRRCLEEVDRLLSDPSLWFPGWAVIGAWGRRL